MKRGDKNIWLLSSSSFFNDVGNEMITALLPIYLTALGGGGAALGLISGLREGLASLLKLLGGWLSDRIGKRLGLVFFGYFISVLLKYLVSFANSWQSLTTFVSFERAGKLRDAPRDAIISQSTKKTGKGFGIYQFMDSSGAVIGTLLLIFLFWKFAYSFKTIAIIAAVISSIALIPLFFVKEKKFQATKKSLFEGIHRLDKKLKYFLFVNMLFTLANFGLYMFLIVLAKEISGSTIFALSLFAIFSLILATGSAYFGNLSDSIGRRKILIFGYILFIAISIGLAQLHSIFWISILFSIYGITFAIGETIPKAIVADLSKEMKGTAIGFYHFTKGITAIAAGLIAGLIWDVNQDWMFYYLALVAFVAIIFLIFFKETKK